ncbi:MAG: hypothetical protein WAQ28_16385 [Bacteroidia bacterium]|jgi:hypothetical protein
MKKAVLGLFISLVIFTGCKKNYTCSCKIKDIDSTGFVYNTAVYVKSEKSKSDDDLRATCEPEAKAQHGIQPQGNPAGASRAFNCTVTKE